MRVLGGVRHGRTTGRAARALHRQPRRRQLGRRAGGGGAAGRAAAPRSRWSCRGPGHADLGGALLYGLDDIRDVIERASARETAAKVACGAVAKGLLAALGCTRRQPRRRHRRRSTAESGMSLDDVEAVEAESGALRRRGGRPPHDGGDRRGARRPETRSAAWSRCSRSGTRPASAATCRATCVCGRRLAGAVLSRAGDRGRRVRSGLRRGRAARQPGPRPDRARCRARLRAREQPRRRHRGWHLDRRDDRRCAPR